LLDHQNNYVECLSVDNNAKSINILITSLSVLRNYFDGPNKIIFRELVKFLDASAHSFFSCNNIVQINKI